LPSIQKVKNLNLYSPIILTGYQALNKLLGKEIYTTNDQLGGPMIMFPNGVTHLLAETHLDTVKKALTWLSYVPASKKSHLPIRDITGVDVVDRLVEFYPKKGISYDPRHLITGVVTEDTWESGLFDRDSFVEVLGGWAKTVVTGRARLGGIPLGIIVTENRTSEAFILADPADPTSQEKILQQAGGVWFPDSAYKTAQVHSPLHLPLPLLSSLTLVVLPPSLCLSLLA
jgi:acetyl-CoA carboxylase / biotin carboxylase 1